MKMARNTLTLIAGAKACCLPCTLLFKLDKWAWLTLGGLLGLLAGFALAADDYPIYVYPCFKAETPPEIDGKLDEAVWQQAPLVSGFTLFGTDQPVNPQTSFRLLWDDQCLYLGVHCDEPQMDKISPVKYALDEHAIFSSETIEFFIDPDHTHDVYYQLAFNITGSVYDGERMATFWNSGARVGTFWGPDFWTAECAVSWKALKTRPHGGKIVGFNVNRDRNIGQKVWATWARVRDGFHDPDRFAHLVLSGTPEMIGQLASELRQGGRTGPLVIFSAEGFAQTTYQKLAEIAFAQMAQRLAALEEIRRQEKDPLAAEEISRRRAEFAARIEALKPQLSERLDAAMWIRLDLELQKIAAELENAVWEARLTALLNAI